MPDKRIKETSVKNCTYFYYDDIINTNNFNPTNKNR